MKKIVTVFLFLILLTTPLISIKADETLQIYEDNIYTNNRGDYATIYWATNKEANCNVAYRPTANVINTNEDDNLISGFGELIQSAGGNNDGRFHYTKQITTTDQKYYKIFCIDNDGITRESSIKHLVPDLEVASIEAPNGIKLNENSLVIVSIRNNNDRTVAVDYDLLTNSLGAEFTSQTDNVPYALAAGEIFEYKFYLKYRTPGNYLIKAEIDSENKFNEANEDNNIFIKNITVSAGQPDLFVQDVSFYPRSPYLGENFSGQIKINVKNIGDGSVLSGATNTSNLVRVVAVLSNDWLLLNKPSPNYKYVGDIAPNEIEEVIFNVNNLKIDSGQLELRIWLDSNSLTGNNYYDLLNDNLNINESNEDNNTYYVSYELVSENPICTDTDGGRNYYQPGTCHGTAAWGSKSSPAEYLSDSCTSPTRLNEVWCGADGYVYQESYNCPNGCTNGACVSTPQEKEEKDVSYHAPLIAQRLKGKLLLQVEQGGAIWYVDDINYRRHLATWHNALPLFERFALGISNTDLLKIPADLDSINFYLDSDSDGYTDRTELSNGYNPYERGGDRQEINIDENLINRLKGKFLLQVEQGGAVWYVDFQGVRHNVRWNNLRELFEELALGINNNDLGQIDIGN